MDPSSVGFESRKWEKKWTMVGKLKILKWVHGILGFHFCIFFHFKLIFRPFKILSVSVFLITLDFHFKISLFVLIPFDFSNVPFSFFS